jgi:acetylornithine/N-succinyldiaminopimelate aminotransferase
MTQRQLFLQHIGQTSDAPLCFEIEKAEGVYLYDTNGKKYIDAIGGISVANIGHSHPAVIEAITKQSQKYLHTMVYGEMVQSPQVQYAKALVDSLPKNLNAVFFTNSGTEATEGAMKLAKRHTGRNKIIAFNKSYHGSTQGALSLIGDEYWRNAYRPLLPEVYHYNYNDDAVLKYITNDIACVIVEPIQAESGVMAAKQDWLNDIRKACTENGVLLIFDEAQSGFGRTGTLWAMQRFNINPDILLLAKAIGGGMPLGAFIADKKIMDTLTHHPVLGHLSTFGGHPVSCAAGLAAFNVLKNATWLTEVEAKGKYMAQKLLAANIECFTQEGLWLAIFFKDYTTTKKIVDACIENGVFTDWFLFASNALRISPPLSISYMEIDEMCKILISCIKENL